MCIGEEDYLNRKWSPYPAMRHVLQGKALQYGTRATSVEDHWTDDVPRTIEIALFALEYRGAIAECKDKGGCDVDVARLRVKLRGISDWLARIDHSLSLVMHNA
jgi:hypothetical protein